MCSNDADHHTVELNTGDTLIVDITFDNGDGSGAANIDDLELTVMP